MVYSQEADVSSTEVEGKYSTRVITERKRATERGDIGKDGEMKGRIEDSLQTSSAGIAMKTSMAKEGTKVRESGIIPTCISLIEFVHRKSPTTLRSFSS